MWLAIELQWLVACVAAEWPWVTDWGCVFNKLEVTVICCWDQAPVSSSWSTWWWRNALWASWTPYHTLYPLTSICAPSFPLPPTFLFSFLFLPQFSFNTCELCKRWTVLGVFSCVIHHLSLVVQPVLHLLPARPDEEPRNQYLADNIEFAPWRKNMWINIMLKSHLVTMTAVLQQDKTVLLLTGLRVSSSIVTKMTIIYK